MQFSAFNSSVFLRPFPQDYSLPNKHQATQAEPDEEDVFMNDATDELPPLSRRDDCEDTVNEQQMWTQEMWTQHMSWPVEDNMQLSAVIGSAGRRVFPQNDTATNKWQRTTAESDGESRTVPYLTECNAIVEQECRMAQEMLNSLTGYDNYLDKSGNTLLHRMIFENNYQAVAELVQTRKDMINCANSEGKTPLGLAAWTGLPEITKLLLNAGASIETLTPKDLLHMMSFLDAALFFTHKETIKEKINRQTYSTEEKNHLAQCRHIFNTLNSILYKQQDHTIHRSNRHVVATSIATTLGHFHNIQRKLHAWSLKTKAYKILSHNPAYPSSDLLKKSILAMREQEKSASRCLQAITDRDSILPDMIFVQQNAQGSLEGFAITENTLSGVKIKALVAKPPQRLQEHAEAHTATLRQLIQSIGREALKSGIYTLYMQPEQNSSSGFEELGFQNNNYENVILNLECLNLK